MDLIDEINLKAQCVDALIEELEEMARVLDEVRPFGLSLQQMYAKTNAISSKEDPRYEVFLQLKSNNPFKSYKYDELKNAVDSID